MTPPSIYRYYPRHSQPAGLPFLPRDKLCQTLCCTFRWGRSKDFSRRLLVCRLESAAKWVRKRPRIGQTLSAVPNLARDTPARSVACSDSHARSCAYRICAKDEGIRAKFRTMIVVPSTGWDRDTSGVNRDIWVKYF